MSSATEFVQYALSINALELVLGGRKLKSGRISPYFFNSGLFCTGESISMLADAYVAPMEKFYPDVVFGPAYKGIPLAVAVSQAIDGDVGYAFNRKEEKDHGEGGIMIGANLEGMDVAIVDDVMTTGTSSGEAVEMVRRAKGNPICCVIAFDRQERGSGILSAVQEFERNYQIPVIAAATLTDLIAVIQEKIERQAMWSRMLDASSILQDILEYKKQYGV